MAAARAPFELGGHTIAAGSSATIELPVADLYTHTPVHLPVRVLHYGLLAILSLTIVAALTAVGIILAIALLIGPGAVAFLLVRRFDRMLLVSLAVALFSSFFGVYLSFFLDSAPAPTIVLLMTGLFVAAFIYTLRRNAREDAAREVDGGELGVGR